jgi:hypothetical protein
MVKVIKRILTIINPVTVFLLFNNLAPIDDICYLDKIIHKYQNLTKLDDFAYLGGEYSSLASFNEYYNIVKYSVLLI